MNFASNTYSSSCKKVDSQAIKKQMVLSQLTITCFRPSKLARNTKISALPPFTRN